jgi:PAS domain S-box-containing protein
VKWLQWSASANAPKALIYGVGRDITRQKEIEKSLAASDQFFKMSYDIFVVAEGDYFVKINPAYTRILGRTQEDMNKTPFMIFAHPDDAKATLEALSKLRSGVPMVSYRARAQAKDGSYKWLDWTATVDLQSGTLYGIARDVTQLIEDETSLKMANKFFNMAFDMLTIVKNKRFIKINPAFTKLLGYEQKDLDNIIFTDLTHPDDKEITDQVLARLMNGETVANFQNRLHNKDGTYKWFDWKGNFDVEQGILYSVARDITEKVLMETEQQLVTKLLHENEERLRLVIENISEGVIVANPEREVVMSNDMANIILGIEANEKIPFDLTDRFELFLPDEKTVFPAQNLPMERALAGQETNDLDLIIRNSYQKKRVLISGRPLVDNEKNIVAAVITIKDISNYKQLEEELKEYRQLIGYKASEKA